MIFTSTDLTNQTINLCDNSLLKVFLYPYLFQLSGRKTTIWSGSIVIQCPNVKDGIYLVLPTRIVDFQFSGIKNSLFNFNLAEKCYLYTVDN
jgi:hypothetical protein